jgi:PEP-CTERM motif
MLKHARNLIGAVGLTLAIAQPAWATVQIVPPGDDVAGHSQLYWAQAWWQWALGVPAANNPLTDTSGADAGVNNGGPLFFLAAFLSVNGGSGPPSVRRTITVREGTPIFFPVINSFYAPIGTNGGFNPFPPCMLLTLACAIQAASITQASDMAVQLDGATLLDNAQIETFRQTSTSFFPVALPPDNVFSLFGLTIQPCCTDQTFWTQDGFYVALNGLSVGTHVLQFEGEGQTFSGPFSLSVTDTLNVTVPEPSTWAMMLVGFASLGFAAYRRQRAQFAKQRDAPQLKGAT